MAQRKTLIQAQLDLLPQNFFECDRDQELLLPPSMRVGFVWLIG